jgi:hypothetical protein
MFSLQPYEYFTLFIQLDNHTDIDRDNYYVQSVIRNARTSDVLAVVNLDSKGEGEYSKPWQVPADPSGLGLFIKVVTTVYTDEAHTTKAAGYGQEGSTYLIAERQQPHAGGGSIDYKKIQKMIDDSVSKIKIPESEVPTLDLSPVLSEISSLYNALNEIPRYKDSAKELGEIRGAISAISASIKGLEKTESNLNLSPITDKLDSMSTLLENIVTGQDIRFDIVEAQVENTRKKISSVIKKESRLITDKLDEDNDSETAVGNESAEAVKDYRGKVIAPRKNRA